VFPLPRPGAESRLARLLSHLRTPLYGGAYALVLSAASSSLLGLVYWTLAARLYAPDVVGINAAAISALTFISYLTQLNMAGVLSRFIPVAGAATSPLISRAYLAAGVASAAGATIFVAGFAHLVGLSGVFRANPWLAAWFVVAAVAWSVFAIQDGALTGLRRTAWVPIENSVFGVAKIVLLVAFVAGPASFGIFASWTIPAVLLLLPVNWLIFRRFVPRRDSDAADPGSAVSMPRGIMRYLSGDYVGALFYAASIGLLPLVVVGLVGPEGGAYFYIAWTIAASLYFVSWSMATSLTVEGAARRANLAADARRMLRLLLGLQALAVTVVVIGAPLILSIFGPIYASEATTLLRLLALAVIPHGINMIYLSVARVQRRVGRIILVQATLAGCVLALSVPLVRAYGIGGAGIAWLVPYSVVGAFLLVNELVPLMRGRVAAEIDGRKTVAPAGATSGEPRALPPLLRTTFAALDAAGIRWCLLRGDPDDLARGARDVDLLVTPADWVRLGGILAGLGMLQVPGYGRGPGGFFVGRDAQGSWVHLDVAVDLAYGRFLQFETGMAPGCVDRSERVDGIRVLAPSDRFWALVLHSVLDKGDVSERHALRLQSLVDRASDGGPLGEFAASILPSGWDAARVIAAVRSGSWDDLGAQRTGILLRLYRRDRLGSSRRVLVRAAQRGVGFARLARRRWGLSVALLGPDGAGKTTLAASIAGDFGIPVSRIYMGMWSQSDPGPLGRVPGLSIIARPFTACRKGLAGQYERARGRLVIFDRYTYDALIPPRGRLKRLKRAYFWCLARVAPPPQMVVVLDAPGAVLFARKGEFDPTRLEEERLAFRALGDRLKGFHIVDASRPAAAVQEEVTALIWKQFLDDAGSYRMARHVIHPLTDGMARIRLNAARRHETGSGALTRRSTRLPEVLAELRAAGIVAQADWIAHQARWSDTGVAIVATGPRGEPAQLVVKFPGLGSAVKSLEAQRATLATLHADPRLVDWMTIVPRVVHAGRIGDLPYFVETALPGRPGSKLFMDPEVRRRLLPAAAEAMAGLHQRTATRALVDDARLEQWIEDPVRAVATVLPTASGGGSGLVHSLEALRRELRSGFAGGDLSVGWIHGDYWPGNVLATTDGTRVTGIVDWDLAADRELALNDLVHLILLGRRLVSGQELGDVVRGLLDGDPLEPTERSALAAGGGAEFSWERDARQLVLLAWLRHVGVFALIPGDGSNPKWVRRNITAVLAALGRPGGRRAR
jgi:O-antigen/teichoic acid export membrane protein/aminoglycoside phosphotransferase (APT) family kinase protein/thymidylate kinase